MNIEQFAQIVEKQQRGRLIREGFTIDKHHANYIASVRPGKKYTKVDFGSSGFLMVENETGCIFGIKGYGVINRKKLYGTLETVEAYNWGGYTPVKLQEATP